MRVRIARVNRLRPFREKTRRSLTGEDVVEGMRVDPASKGYARSTAT
jgi:hypothetical protein